MKISTMLALAIAGLGLVLNAPAQMNAPRAHSPAQSPFGNAIPNSAFQGNFILTPPNPAIQGTGMNPNVTIPQLAPGQGLIPPVNQTVMPPVNQTVIPPVATPPVLPPSGVQPVLPPPNIQPVLPPNTPQPVLPPQTLQPAMPPQNIQPALTSQGVGPAVNPPVSGSIPQMNLQTTPVAPNPR